MSDLCTPLHGGGKTSFQARHSTHQTRYYIPILIRYCWDVTKAKDMPAVEHWISVRIPCDRCLNILDAAWHLQCDGHRTLTEIKLVRNYFRSGTPACQPASVLYCLHNQASYHKCIAGFWERVTIRMVFSFWTGRLPNKRRCSRHVCSAHFQTIAQLQSCQSADVK